MYSTLDDAPHTNTKCIYLMACSVAIPLCPLHFEVIFGKALICDTILFGGGSV